MDMFSECVRKKNRLITEGTAALLALIGMVLFCVLRESGTAVTASFPFFRSLHLTFSDGRAPIDLYNGLSPASFGKRCAV